MTSENKKIRSEKLFNIKNLKTIQLCIQRQIILISNQSHEYKYYILQKIIKCNKVKIRYNYFIFMWNFVDIYLFINTFHKYI